MDVRGDDHTPYFTPRIAKEPVAAFVRTPDHVIIGAIFVKAGARLTDELNSDTAAFLAMTDARIFSATDDTLVYSSKLSMVAFRNILLVGELEDVVSARGAAWQHASSGGDHAHGRGPLSSVRLDEKGKYFSPRVAKDAMAVHALLPGLALAGHVYLRPERRLRDELNETKLRFLPLTEARVFDTGDRALYDAGFLLVSHDHIATLSPLEGVATDRSAPWLDVHSRESA